MPQKLDDCVKKVRAQGKSESSAYAICNDSLYGSSKVEIDDQDDHLWLRAFLLDSSVNQNAWGVSKDTLQQNIQTYIGKPLVVQEDFQHPDSGDPNYDHHLQYQERFRIGNITAIAEKNGIYSAIIDVTDPTAKQAFRNGDLPLYVSPQLFHDGVGKEADDNAITWRGTHLAVVKEPAFGVKKARIEGQCNGNAQTCVAQLKRASCTFCIKKTIQNYVSNKQNQTNSSLENKTVNNSSKLNDSKEESTNKETISNQTVSIEEFNKLKESNDKLLAENTALKQTNNQITEENKTVSASLESLKGEYRKDKVSGILANVFYKTDDERNSAIDSLTKSAMSYEEIDKLIAPLKVKSASANQETKLPQKSASTESVEMSSWARLYQLGGSN